MYMYYMYEYLNFYNAKFQAHQKFDEEWDKRYDTLLYPIF